MKTCLAWFFFLRKRETKKRLSQTYTKVKQLTKRCKNQLKAVGRREATRVNLSFKKCMERGWEQKRRVANEKPNLFNRFMKFAIWSNVLILTDILGLMCKQYFTKILGVRPKPKKSQVYGGIVPKMPQVFSLASS